MRPPDPGLRVIGAGWGRTGTKSLSVALSAILGGTCLHFSDLINNPDRIKPWLSVFERIEKGQDPLWWTVFENIVATTDFPGAAFWRELAAAYPEALVLLSTRDPESWFESLEYVVLRSYRHRQNKPDKGEPHHARVGRLSLARAKLDIWASDEEIISAFQRHNDEVRNEIPKDRLLEWRVEDGWRPICERLNLAIPEAEFPRENRRGKSALKVRARHTKTSAKA